MFRHEYSQSNILHRNTVKRCSKQIVFRSCTKMSDFDLIHVCCENVEELCVKHSNELIVKVLSNLLMLLIDF